MTSQSASGSISPSLIWRMPQTGNRTAIIPVIGVALTLPMSPTWGSLSYVGGVPFQGRRRTNRTYAPRLIVDILRRSHRPAA